MSCQVEVGVIGSNHHSEQHNQRSNVAVNGNSGAPLTAQNRVHGIENVVSGCGDLSQISSTSFETVAPESAGGSDTAIATQSEGGDKQHTTTAIHSEIWIGMYYWMQCESTWQAK